MLKTKVSEDLESCLIETLSCFASTISASKAVDAHSEQLAKTVFGRLDRSGMF